METQPTIGGTCVMRASALPTGPLSPRSMEQPTSEIEITVATRRDRMRPDQARRVPEKIGNGCASRVAAEATRWRLQPSLPPVDRRRRQAMLHDLMPVAPEQLMEKLVALCRRRGFL